MTEIEGARVYDNPGGNAGRHAEIPQVPLTGGVIYERHKAGVDDKERRWQAELKAADPEEQRITHMLIAGDPVLDQVLNFGRKENIALERALYRLTALRVFHPETFYHSRDVAKITAKQVQYLDLPVKDKVLTVRGALLHDPGKFNVPYSIINAPFGYQMTPEEVTARRKHVEYGYEMLIEDGDPDTADIMAIHHKFKSTEPYPDNFPLDINNPRFIQGAFIGLSDVTHALLNQRVYKPPWTTSQTKEVLYMDYYHPIRLYHQRLGMSFNEASKISGAIINSNIEAGQNLLPKGRGHRNSRVM